jgi:hypothetical protein
MRHVIRIFSGKRKKRNNFQPTSRRIEREKEKEEKKLVVYQSISNRVLAKEVDMNSK